MFHATLQPSVTAHSCASPPLMERPASFRLPWMVDVFEDIMGEKRAVVPRIQLSQEVVNSLSQW